MFEQRTLKKPVNISGIGVHTGLMVNLKLIPSERNQGIRFIRSDIKDKENTIKARYENVVNSLYCTEIANSNGVNVKTIEHLMSAIWCMKITNLDIEIDGQEVPIMNGSASDFVFAIEAAGIKKQDCLHNTLKILKNVKYEKNKEQSIEVSPAQSFIAEMYIDSDLKIISKGSGYIFDDAKQSFINDISMARTFCKLKDVEKIKSMGLAKGGGLQNALVIDGDKVLNENGLNYTNECVRHKILDLIGDMALCPYYICGHFIGRNSGHEVNNFLLKEIFEDESNYQII